eukprot:gnl/TRDRNA2_/TRDRNA2_45138_c0_seq1.p1 gnl/TRDRNA2_/TRDRNA2_45138_c0~~gnl/TRDRNA2_/TRDRNA2_45138_c0_seq1.p1  ORF type:complete len:363 (-),score=56.41 gnl/TRDRNA2_/TRDRNA2_45138_c0_seq1:30-1118(-)
MATSSTNMAAAESSASGCGPRPLQPGPIDPVAYQQQAGVPEKSPAGSFGRVKQGELHFVEKIGSGGQAEVYKAEWTRKFKSTKSSITVAVKWLHPEMGSICRDREALMLDHPNLVRCLDATLEPPYIIVTEMCIGGSLFDLLYNTCDSIYPDCQQQLCPRQQVKILLDVSAGLSYLHSQSPCILHRDLKSSNVLLQKQIADVSQEPLAKIADFGFSRSASQRQLQVKMTKGVGTSRWMAPEVVDSNSPDGEDYDESADVFSFGIVMYEVLIRKLPYMDAFPPDKADTKLAWQVCLGLRPPVPENFPQPGISPTLGDLMKRSWDGEPSARPSAAVLARELREALSICNLSSNSLVGVHGYMQR